MKGKLRSVITNIKNIPGWKTNRKLIVFESDDWGSERMPSLAALESLMAKNIIKKPNSYDKYDSLEQKEDLDLLFYVLHAHKDVNNNPCVFTPFVNTCNPDYDKIAADDYENYYAEPFNITLKRKKAEHDTMALWKQGIEDKIFMPQFHGREHLNVYAWMRELKNNNPVVREAFKDQFYAPRLSTLKDYIQSFRPTYYFDSFDEVEQLNKSTTEGLEIFKTLFNKPADVFVPANGIYNNICDKALFDGGIKAIGTSHVRDVPNGKGAIKKKYFISGMKNNMGQVYYIRNAQFEPTLGKGIGQCIDSVEAAFRWGKPAVISSHRINYIGTLNQDNRRKGLEQLSNLLGVIKNRWPQAEFVSSEDLLKIMST